jgi:hypothetical protein
MMPRAKRLHPTLAALARVSRSVAQRYCRTPDGSECGLGRVRNMTRIVVNDAPR